MAKIHKHNTWALFSPKYVLTWLALPILWSIGRLPHKYIITVGSRIGRLLHLLLPKRRYIIKTNLTLCFPNKSKQEINQLVKQNFITLGIGVCETAMAWCGSEASIKTLEKNVTIENEHILKHVLNDEKPVLLITPHAASQELLSKVIARKYEFSPVFRHMNNPVANYLMQKARLNIYKNPILKANTREIVKSLKQKVTIGILPDQDFGRKRSVFVPFFGVPAATTTAVSKYKKMTDCHVVSLSYLRNKDNKGNDTFHVYISTPLDITGTDLEHDALELNKEFEKIISRDIPMYFWVARRFKTRPLGEPKIYNYKSIYGTK